MVARQARLAGRALVRMRMPRPLRSFRLGLPLLVLVWAAGPGVPPAEVAAPAGGAAAALAPLPLPAGLRWREDPRLGALFRQAGLEGTFVLLDARRALLVGTNRSRALSRYTPASTFKIANSLIGLSVGAVASVDTVLPYRSDAPPFSQAWQKDMGLREAIVVSNVPIYQELARRIGLERMRQAVNRLDYGNRAIGGQVDTFWLRGPLAISAVEQTRFLDRLARGVLPFPAEAQRAVRDITLVERGPGWELHAKTGWQNGPGPGVGWWVGWLERGGRAYPFALNLDIRQPADGEQRQRLGRAALRQLGLLPAAPSAAAAP
jgi:beta-lactamase class D